MDGRELLWRQYSQNVELYKFYMELVIKINTFYYAITGAIFSFYFANKAAVPEIKYSLVLPLAMSIGFAIFFVYGGVLMTVMRNEVFDIRDALELRAAPDLGVLSVFLYIFFIVFLVVIVGSAYLLWCR